MPAPIENAECGPQVPGTERPDNWDNIASLNPCPLNACCDIWGQCGISDKFCTKTNSTTGAPGTAAPDTNGCISNCGTDVVKTSVPSKLRTIKYFEAFNMKRPCLNLDVNAIPKDGYTYIHFAFAGITPEYQVNVSDIQEQFDKFKELPPPARVLAFGGWSFSTSQDTYPIFRQGVTEGQRETFADNVVQFLIDNDLDGLDFDWEYPSAPDIPGIPSGSSSGGEDYLAFLKLVRSKLPSEKTLSIAAPASYWYLRGFPIAEISEVVDYIVYMTYDLHGQWDYGNPYSISGCPTGDCLRSHVNNTEIILSLSMITKAGVPGPKIVAGVASYGRSFGMVDSNCPGPHCHFTGPESGARRGMCTQTAGYMANAEIRRWIDHGQYGNYSMETYWDEPSRSIITYSSDGTWVAYMNDTERDYRYQHYIVEYWLSGTSLWAMDLTEFVPQLPDGNRMPPFEYTECSEAFHSLDALSAAANIPDICMNVYLMQALSGNLTSSLNKYNEILENDYDEKFGYYVNAVKAASPHALDDFLHANVTKYFDCIAEMRDDDGNGYHNETSPDCFYLSPELFGKPPNIYWEPKNLTLFEADLLASTGIAPDWIRYERREYYHDCMEHDPTNSVVGCQGAKIISYLIGYPRLKDDYEVYNPKEPVAKLHSNLTALEDTLDFTALEARYFMYEGSTSDVVDGSSLLVLMVSSSVQSMKEVAAIGEEYHEQKIMRMIFFFLSFILMLIPGLGELALAANMARMARLLSTLRTAGEAAIATYDVVTHPENAPAAIFGALLGGFSMIKAPTQFGKAAAARRAMSPSHVKALGAEVDGGMAQVNKLVQKCF